MNVPVTTFFSSLVLHRFNVHRLTSFRSADDDFSYLFDLRRLNWLFAMLRAFLSLWGTSPAASMVANLGEKNPGCLGYIGDYTTQLHRDYNKPL